ncbi:MAG: hypothetical protein KIS66_12510 [Fimbriimonadaceae bacterium]|nr:hypothetical protein [Fimbriimonadaceae bacterium]
MSTELATAPCEGEPAIAPDLCFQPFLHEVSGLWLYGNVRLLSSGLGTSPSARGPSSWDRANLARVQMEAEILVLSGGILVCGCHNDAHRLSAVVPLRYGAPRVLVLSGGFRYHLGPELDREPFAIAALWRYRFDPTTDLAVSRRAPDKPPTFARHNPTVDRLIVRIASGSLATFF